MQILAEFGEEAMMKRLGYVIVASILSSLIAPASQAEAATYSAVGQFSLSSNPNGPTFTQAPCFPPP